MSLKKEEVIFRDPFTFTFNCPLGKTHNQLSRPWRRTATGGRRRHYLSVSRLSCYIVTCHSDNIQIHCPTVHATRQSETESQTHVTETHGTETKNVLVQGPFTISQKPTIHNEKHQSRTSSSLSRVCGCRLVLAAAVFLIAPPSRLLTPW